MQAVRLVADLSLDNGIYDIQLWNSVLQQLLAFGMVRGLYCFLVNYGCFQKQCLTIYILRDDLVVLVMPPSLVKADVLLMKTWQTSVATLLF